MASNSDTQTSLVLDGEWDDDTIAEMQRRHLEGEPWSQIAEHLRRSVTACHAKVNRLRAVGEWQDNPDREYTGKVGRPSYKVPTRQLQLRCSWDVDEALRDVGGKLDVRIGELVADAVRRYVEHRAPKKWRAPAPKHTLPKQRNLGVLVTLPNEAQISVRVPGDVYDLAERLIDEHLDSTPTMGELARKAVHELLRACGYRLVTEE